MAKTQAETPDEVLVVAAILGDFDAFNELVGRYRAAAVRTAHTVVGALDAEDVAQEALLLAFKALPSIEDPGKFASWLMVITRHRALRWHQQERKRRARHQALDAVLLEQLSALTEPLAYRREATEELTHALATLPDDYALVLRLRFFDGMLLQRIAAVLDVPVSTVKWRVFRGKQLLREAVDHLRKTNLSWNES
jgi:RNA polymerase sigma-70 factor (ECF subfamily)